MYFFQTLITPFIQYKYLLWQLIQREIKARYKQSFIGYAWVILNPLSQLLVYSFVFSTIFKFQTGTIPYVIFLSAALLPWSLFQNSISTATQGLVDNSGLLRKVAFPREVIIYAIVLAKLVDFGISLCLFALFMVFFQVPISFHALYVFPILAIQLLLTLGISLVLSTCNLFYRDIQYLTNLLLMLWMYMTPIVYSLVLVPQRYLWLYTLNPMVGLIEGYRSALFRSPLSLNLIAWSAILSAIIFFLGLTFFKKNEQIFADIA